MLKLACLPRLVVTAILLPQSVLGIATERTFITPSDTETYIASFENICRVVDDIVQTSPDERTFENILGKWIRVTDEITSTMRTFGSVEHSQDAYDYYCLLNAEIFENTFLRDALFSYAQYSLSETILNPYQRYIIECFLGDDCRRQTSGSAFSSIRGLAQEKSIQEKGNTTFALSKQEVSEVSLEVLLEKILNADADLIYFEEIAAVGEFGEIYSSLKEQYAHFYTTAVPRGLALDFLNPSTGYLIASKYPINQSQLTTLSINSANHQEDDLQVCQNVRPHSSAFLKQPSNLLSLCRHKEKVEIEHETDDDGKSKTKMGGQFEYENKNGYWVKGKAWTEKNEGKGKSNTESGAEVEAGKKF